MEIQEVGRSRIGGQSMRANLFWFDDEQWAKIERLIPTNRPGPKPQNNRLILSGIMHVLKSGCRWPSRQDRPIRWRWQDCPPEYGRYTIASTAGARGEFGNKFSRRAHRHTLWQNGANVSRSQSQGSAGRHIESRFSLASCSDGALPDAN